MLTSDREVNRDFDVNNLFLNLDFQHQEETFEYKWPLLDHPSNYQMIVTKLLTRTSLPYIKLHETKTYNKRDQDYLKENDKVIFNYEVKMKFDFLSHENYLSAERQNSLFTYNNLGARIDKKCFPLLTDDPQKINNNDLKERYEKVLGIEIDNINQINPWIWYDVGEHRNIYSLDRVFHMINNALKSTISDMCKFYQAEYYISKNFLEKKIWLFSELDYNIIYFRLEDNVPYLCVLNDLLDCLKMDAVNRDNANKPIREMSLYFSKNLAKFLKGFHFIPCSEYEGEFIKFYISQNEKAGAESEEYTRVIRNYDDREKTEEVDLTYRVFKGEKLNIMELSDYIGLAITSPDFPIKEQIYPQYYYDFNDKIFRDNRRHYTPASEFFIGVITDGVEKWSFSKENITELNKYSTGDKILFVKYFDPKTEDLNAISYENNNSATTLKMDLMNVMPLKKFTLKLYLIDRYNNFEPLIPKIEGYDDVIKLQLLFTRIKGTEKENRNIIETKKEVPERYIMGLEELDDNKYDDEEEEEITNEPEILPDIKVISVPAITKDNDEILPDINVIPIPAINTEKEQDSDDEDDIEAPPEKRIYLGNENEDSENENELY